MAEAAEFDKSTSSNGEPDIIFVTGDLTRGDEQKFVDIALNSKSAIVTFQSRGGNLVAGIEIGRAIHLKGFATFVPDVQCASACALAWLGGRVRYMSDTAQVGFHAVYVDKDGQPTVSSSGNALVGAYLSQLNLPASAIIYITEAPPEGMQWLNFGDAQHFGIDVHPFNLSARPAQQSGTTNRSSSVQISAVRKEFDEFIDAINHANDSSLFYFGQKYSDKVRYFGKLVPKQSVLNDKGAFFEKWPVRDYSVQPGSVIVTCKTSSECTAEGVLDWKISGPILNSRGSATFSLLWILEDGIWKISSESSQPIERKVLDVHAPEQRPR
jgi:hypothetical protein